MVELSPVDRYDWETTDPEEAHDWLRQAYTGHTARLSGDRAHFRMSMGSAAVDLFRVDHLRHTMTVDALVDPHEALLVAQPRAGCLRIHGGGDEFEQGPGGVMLAEPFRSSRVEWPWTEMQLVRLELEPAQKIAGEITGLPPSQVRFGLSVPVDENRLRYWASVVEHVRFILAQDELAAAPLIRADAFRALTTALLATFPNNAMEASADRPASGTLGAEPAVVRRAVEFIDANAHLPIGLGGIAEAARISPRGLQHAFRRHRDITPLGYLKHVRLGYARTALLSGDPTRGDTVATIAARWGFSNPGRFAVEYRQRFGCSPSDTLRS